MTGRLHMRGALPLRALVLAMTALGLGCGERFPNEPRTAAPSLEHGLLLERPAPVQVATRVAPLPPGAEASAVIGPRGGVLLLPQAGLIVMVPRGALSSDTRLSVRAVPGSMVAYEFEPHGITFEQPVMLLQQFNGTHGVDVSGGIPAFEGAYFADASQLDAATNGALANEILPAEVAPSRRYVFFHVHHFSGYLLASGRR